MIFSKKFLALVLILILAGVGFWLKKDGYFTKTDPNLYYAVFLTNGQVYFGNLKSKTDSEFVLTDVHYLQLEDGESNVQGQLSESRFTLIKMGQEIHGPTDELYINKDNILFYEKLRSDSKVVESIRQSKS